jgi:hypothetical protein
MTIPMGDFIVATLRQELEIRLVYMRSLHDALVIEEHIAVARQRGLLLPLIRKYLDEGKSIYLAEISPILTSLTISLAKEGIVRYVVVDLE